MIAVSDNGIVVILVVAALLLMFTLSWWDPKR